MTRRPFLGAALLVMATVGQAASLTLNEVQEKALAANPRIRAANLDALAAAQRAAEAKGRHFGTLDLVGNYSNFESPRLVRSMSIDLFTNPAAGFAQLPWDANQVHYGVAFEIPLLAGGSLHEGDRIAALAHSAAEQIAQFSREEIRTAVRAAYRNALLAGHTLAAAQGYREALVKDEADAQLRVKIGALAPVDAAKITFALRGAEAQVAALTAQGRTAQAVLAAFLGEESPAAGYELVDLPDEPSTPTTGGNPTEQALAARLDLAAVRQATQVTERKKVLAREAFGPRLSLEGNWLRNDAPSLGHALDTHEFYVMLKLPLFDGFTRAHALKEAEVDVQAARERERAKELEVVTQVADALGRVEAARAQLAAGKAQRELGREVARVEHLKLEEGTGKVEDYLAARAQELAGATAYWSGLYALQNAVDYLDFVRGREGVER
ncbi:MAG: TolC family protein [Acidobacteriota bacterium]